jgi:hypothetical protein
MCYLQLLKKVLDRSGGPVLYKPACADELSAHEESKAMLTTNTYKEHSMKWQRCDAMYVVVCSAIRFDGRPGQEQSINSRYPRQ